MLALAATGVVVVTNGAPTVDAATTAASVFEPVTPCRLLDTRDGDRLAARDSVDVQVLGRCGVPDDATAVAVTITTVQPAAPGFVVGYPTGTPRPVASSVNYQPGEVVANLQLLQLGSGAVTVYSLAATDLVVDVSGAFVPAPSGSARAGRFVPVEASRAIDTRDTRRPSPESTVRVDTDVPDDAVAVAINLTTTATNGPDVFTAFEAGGDVPLASSLNVDGAGQTRAAAAIVPVHGGDIDVYTLRGNHVIVDVVGYYTGPSASLSSSGLFVSEQPTRLVDTREPYGPSGGPRLWAGGAREFALDDLTGGPVSAVAANVTVTDTEDAGYVEVYPAGTSRPATSTLNYDRPGRTVANLAMTGVSERGITVFALDATELVVDVTGWFTGDPLDASVPVPENSPPASGNSPPNMACRLLRKSRSRRRSTKTSNRAKPYQWISTKQSLKFWPTSTASTTKPPPLPERACTRQVCLSNGMGRSFCRAAINVIACRGQGVLLGRSAPVWLSRSFGLP